MKKVAIITMLALISFLVLSSTGLAGDNHIILTREEFDRWPDLPEYTIFNPFPNKGRNCTWYAHGRMMQLGYCKSALDSMRYNAKSWADSAASGAEVTAIPVVPSIAYWGSGQFFGSILGHVAVVERVSKDGSILVSDSSSSSGPYKTYTINPGDSIWPTAFIVVPKGPGRSNRFYPGATVQTTANNLNFRLEGVNQPSIALPKGIIADVKEHPSNGIYASQPGSAFSYHSWWYAAVELDGEIRQGWLAETYLEAADHPDLITNPDMELGVKFESGSEPGLDIVDEQNPTPETDFEDEPESEPGSDPQLEPGSELEPETDSEPEPEPEPGSDLKSASEPVPDLMPGDINGDGRVDVRDVTLVMQYTLGTMALNESQIQSADLNYDGVLDVRDVVLLMHLALRTSEDLAP